MRPLLLLPILLLPVVASAQLVWEKPLAPGLVYREEVDRATPRVVHALRITPGSPALRLGAEPTGGAINEATSAPTGRTTVAVAAAKLGALAAVNADFFVDSPKGWNGHPLGLLVRAGELLATPNPRRSTFAWGPGSLGPGAFAFGKATWSGSVRREGGASIALTGLNRVAGKDEAVLDLPVAGQAFVGEGDLEVTLKVDGLLAPSCTLGGTVELVSDEPGARTIDAGKAVLVLRGTKAALGRGLKPGTRVAISVKTAGFDGERLDSAVGGGPMLVRDGETAVGEEGFDPRTFVNARHPRTAVGRTADGDLWLVAVDGRSAISAGASLAEMASIMKGLGCVEAMNLDGGGSTDLAAMGLVVNRPSDGRERPVADVLLVRGAVPPPAFGPLRLVVPATVRDGETVDARVVDAKGRTVPNARVLWAASGALWMDQGGRLTVMASGSGLVQAAVDGQVLSAKVVAQKVSPLPMRTLVTGFGPFGNVTDNPSGHLAEGSGRPFRVLEVAYEAADAFLAELNPESFDTLLMLGVAASRDRITPELFARNSRGGTPDIQGKAVPGPVEEGAPLLIESTLWNAHLVANLSVSAGLFASMDAGSYLCNYLSYRSIRRFPQKRVGFLHVPPFEKMSQGEQARVLAKILEEIEK